MTCTQHPSRRSLSHQVMRRCGSQHVEPHFTVDSAVTHIGSPHRNSNIQGVDVGVVVGGGWWEAAVEWRGGVRCDRSRQMLSVLSLSCADNGS